MAPKHNPGPWQYTEDSTILDADGTVILEVVETEQPGNGPLAAAAPTLLAACETYQAWDENPHASSPDASNVRRLIAQAIKLAREDR